MLPPVGQKLALVSPELGTTLIAICIVAAQCVMVPVATLVGGKADVWGRKPIFLVAFAVLAARGALCTVSDSTAWLVGVQLLAGVAAFGLAVFAIATPETSRSAPSGPEAEKRAAQAA
ncbi:MAG: Major Facilitator Superfamily transporter [Enterovirga sp.]|nr:Major Facilitator Superfamily transporter [Enterovirga sp.]